MSCGGALPAAKGVNRLDLIEPLTRREPREPQTAFNYLQLSGLFAVRQLVAFRWPMRVRAFGMNECGIWSFLEERGKYFEDEDARRRERRPSGMICVGEYTHGWTRADTHTHTKVVGTGWSRSALVHNEVFVWQREALASSRTFL